MKTRCSDDGNSDVLVVGVVGDRGVSGVVVILAGERGVSGVMVEIIEAGERGLCGGVTPQGGVIVGDGDGVRGGIVIVV